MGLLRQGHPVRLFRCWESATGVARGQRDAARQQQHLLERSRRILPRHVPRRAQRHRNRHQCRLADDGTARSQTRGCSIAIGIRFADIQVAKFDQGWSVEVAIPFKSLRYATGDAQTWGFNVRRFNRWKNETSFMTPIPRSLGQFGLFHASLAAELTGLEVPSARGIST